MNEDPEILSEEEAKEKGFRPLTTGYRLPEEQPMMDNVIANLKAGNIPWVLVNDGNKGFVEVWRDKKGFA